MKKLLIANRGEIACRIARAARHLGIATVAVHTDLDAGALHVAACDEAVDLGPQTILSPYLEIHRLLEAAQRTGADAIHPGYGFLAERPDFASAVLAAGLIWVGPPAEVMASLGRKDAAKALARVLGVPVVPGFDPARAGDADDADLASLAAELGYPVLIKAVAGGGGRGMRIVRHPQDLAPGLDLAAREAKEAFGDGALLVEKYVEHGRHIEVQILADAGGHILHLGERECSIQRRHQKLIEESPSVAVHPELRAAMTSAAVRLARGVGYVSAGTVEFLLDDASGAFYFLEVNTRIQVEHPVTELVTGLDLVAWQLRIAQGQMLTLAQEDVAFRGHAIEARLCAEDPGHDFLPQAGAVLRWQPPVLDGVRVDHGMHPRDTISVHYDAMVAKIIAWGQDRPTAIARLVRALRQTQLLGLVNNRALLLAILQNPEFVAGRTTTQFLQQHPPVHDEPPLADLSLAAAAIWRHGPALAQRFRNHAGRPDVTVFHAGSRTVHVALERREPDTASGGKRFAWGVTHTPDPLLWRVPRLTEEATIVARSDNALELDAGGLRHRWHVLAAGDQIWLQALDGADVAVREGTLLPVPQVAAAPAGSVTAPGPARVAEIHVQPGDEVVANQPLVTLEAMKMLTILRAPAAGVVRSVLAVKGESVAAGMVVVELTAAGDMTATGDM